MTPEALFLDRRRFLAVAPFVVGAATALVAEAEAGAQGTGGRDPAAARLIMERHIRGAGARAVEIIKRMHGDDD